MPGFAVVDLETTGLFAADHDRIIEIAILSVDPSGRITHRWESLVAPERDLGPQRPDGIAADTRVDAPTFADIAPTVASLLRGRVIVAHDAGFLVGFLSREFGRIPGVDFVGDSVACTMVLARDFLPGVGRTLSACTAACGITLTAVHGAGSRAEATAELLARYLTLDPQLFGSLLARLNAHAAADLTDLHPGLPRERDGEATITDPDFLAQLVARLPASDDDDLLAYLALLDRCLIDHRLSAVERRRLIDAAVRLGIDPVTARMLHEQYFGALVATAGSGLDDHRQAELARVARVLSISGAEHSPDAANARIR